MLHGCVNTAKSTITDLYCNTSNTSALDHLFQHEAHSIKVESEYYALPIFLSAARARAHCRKSERRSRSRSLKFLRAPLALALINQKSAARPRALPEK